MSTTEGLAGERGAGEGRKQWDVAGVTLGVLVVLVALCSFVLPSEWFLFLNPARSEIVDLENRQGELEKNLASEQEMRRDVEQQVQLAQSGLEAQHEALMQLLLRQRAASADSGRDLGRAFNEVERTSGRDTVLNSVQISAMEEAIKSLEQEFQESEAQSEAISVEAKRRNDSQAELNQFQFEFEQGEIRIAGFREEIRVVTARRGEITRQSTNQYLAVRATALGALGAFAASIAAFLHGAATMARLWRGHTMLSMVFGGIVALVVFALFTTREISVFSNEEGTPGEIPDYWRVVILCLIAGAFADRVFAAARERVDQMAGGRG